VELGILSLSDDKKAYSLGIKLLILGTKCLDGISLRQVAHKYLEDLSTSTKSITFLAVENNGKIVYLDKNVHTGATLQPVFDVGMLAPMHCTGLGKAMLAAFTQKKVDEIIKANGLERRTANTITTRLELKKELERIRKRGYSIDNEENEQGIYCFAAPVYDHLSQPIAAISIVTIKFTLGENSKEIMSESIRRTALNISKDMGYSGDRLFI